MTPESNDLRLAAVGKTVARLARRLPIASRLVFRLRLQSRNALLNLMPKGSVCAEIGVWRGAFTERILETAMPEVLHLIDPWGYQGDSTTQWFGGKGGRATRQADMDTIFEQVRSRFGTKGCVRIHRQTSSEAASQFPDSYFDWIYIDGNHTYEYVMADLQNYLSKVKPSGYLAGDDFYWGPNEGFPVKRAVENTITQRQTRLIFQRRGQFVLQKV